MNARDLSNLAPTGEATDDVASRIKHDDPVVAHIATVRKRFVANRETASVALGRYGAGMLDTWLRQALANSTFSQASLSRALTEKLNRSVDRAAVNKMTLGTRKIAADELLAIEGLLGVQAPADDNDGWGIVGVWGEIGAGGSIDTEGEQIGVGDPLYEIRVPFQVPNDAFAFRINGESMWPRYDAGDVIICTRQSQDPAPLVGWEAAVMTLDGNRYLKRLVKGSRAGLYDLESHNAATIRDTKLSWVSEVFGVVRAARWEKLSEAARRKAMTKAVG